MKKSLQKKAQESSYFSQSVDMDPYSTSIIEQLLSSHGEWKEQDEIIKLTFRALTDIIQVHSQSIKDLKSIITTRASKNQLSTGLAMKSNVSDMSKIVQQISSVVDSKVGYADINSILKDYAQKKDLRDILLDNIERQKQPTSRSKTDRKQQLLQMKIMQSRIDEFQRQISKRLGGCVTLPEFQQLISIVEQKVNVTELNDVLENRVTKQYLTTCLQKKVSKSDYEQVINRKVDSTDLDYLINSLENKVSLSTLQKLTEVIEHKADKSDLVLLANQKANKQNLQENSDKLAHFSVNIQNKLIELKKEVEHSKFTINQSLRLVERQNQTLLRNYINNHDFDNVIEHMKKVGDDQYAVLKKNIQNLQKQSHNQLKYDNFMRELTHEINLRKNCEQKLYEEIDDVRRRAEEIGSKTLPKTQFFNFRSELAEMLEEKIETEYVQQAFNKWQVQLNAKMTEDKEQIYTLINRIQKTLAQNISINTNDIMNFRNSNPKKDYDIGLNLVQENVKKIRRSVDDCKKTVDLFYLQIQSKISISQYESDLLEIRKKFDEITRQLLVKANIKDVCVLADSKPNIDDVNKALQELNSALDLKVSETDLQNVLKDQASINQTLCSENIVGRWLWQSGDIKSGGIIPWEVQCANTVPDHFYWQKDKTSILVLSGGIYHLSACIFSKNASLMILVNGESITFPGSENANNMNLYKKAGKKKKEKEFTGSKIQEFVMIPSRSRISVSVSCEGAEGFLNIRRL